LVWSATPVPLLFAELVNEVALVFRPPGPVTVPDPPIWTLPLYVNGPAPMVVVTDAAWAMEKLRETAGAGS